MKHNNTMIRMKRTTLYFAILFSSILKCSTTKSIDDIEVSSSGETRAYRREQSFPFLDLFFSDQRIDDAWEKYPLLSTIYDYLPIDDLNSNSKQKITTIKSSDQVTSFKRSDMMLNMFTLDNIDDIFSSNPDLKHGHGGDFLVCKKQFRENEDWLGIVNKEKLSRDEALAAFNRKGFSLVINGMQKRWGNIATYARIFQSEMYSNHISVNLYLTPPAYGVDGENELPQAHNGFEPHYDWMDVIILQVSGEKLWSVASSPIVYLSNKKLKRKPSIDEVNSYLSSSGHFTEFLLRPGDALYIPRGFLHNASTVGPDYELLDKYISKSSGNRNEYVSNGSSGRSGSPQPSLHLTFGIEQDGTTVADFLVEAVAFFANSFSELIRDDIFCVENDNKFMHSSWESLLQISILEAAERESSVPYHISQNHDVCHLRKMFPRGKWVSVFFKGDESKLERWYEDCLSGFNETAEFDRAKSYMVEYQSDPEYRCDETVPFLQSPVSQYHNVKSMFVDFAMKRYDDIFNHFEKVVRYTVTNIWSKENERLAAVGQKSLFEVPYH